MTAKAKTCFVGALPTHFRRRAPFRLPGWRPEHGNAQKDPGGECGEGPEGIYRPHAGASPLRPHSGRLPHTGCCSEELNRPLFRDAQRLKLISASPGNPNPVKRLHPVWMEPLCLCLSQDLSQGAEGLLSRALHAAAHMGIHVKINSHRKTGDCPIN